MSIPTLLRSAEHEALSSIALSGKVLDLGGDSRSEYRKLLKGNPSFTTVNLDESAVPDILHDLEKPLPVVDASYDHVLLINVLEHVFEYQQLLEEAARAIRPGGMVVVVVPFLFPVHPSPSDYWRFTDTALVRVCEAAGLSVKHAAPLGSGVFGARYVMLDRLLPLWLRFLMSVTLRPLVPAIDKAFVLIGRFLGKKYNASDYALGYLVEARKN